MENNAISVFMKFSIKKNPEGHFRPFRPILHLNRTISLGMASAIKWPCLAGDLTHYD
jgi:hypothetical protein